MDLGGMGMDKKVIYGSPPSGTELLISSFNRGFRYATPTVI